MVLPKDIGISSFESFVATVRVTLQNLHDPSALQTSPLVPLLVRDPVSGITAVSYTHLEAGFQLVKLITRA